MTISLQSFNVKQKFQSTFHLFSYVFRLCLYLSTFFLSLSPSLCATTSYYFADKEKRLKFLRYFFSPFCCKFNENLLFRQARVPSPVPPTPPKCFKFDFLLTTEK